MKRPGLTEAMLRGLRDPKDANGATLQCLFDLGLIDEPNRHASLTPRGQAALAAPRVTAAELAMLERLEGYVGELAPYERRVLDDLVNKGYAQTVFCKCLTPTGTTALNNIRAASGSPDYKEN